MPEQSGEPGPLGLSFLKADLIKSGILTGVLAILSGVIVVVAFDWDSEPTLLGALGGAVVFGVIEYFSRLSERLPSGSVPDPPQGAFIERESLSDEVRWRILWSPILILALVGLAWFADRFEAGGFFLPGSFLGASAATLMAAVIVGSWETRHRKRLLVAEDGEGEETLYAASPVERPDLVSSLGVAPTGPIHPS